MRFAFLGTAALALALTAGLAHAQTAQASILTYEASYFADARPSTAYDMIGRLPAFTFDDGNTARGFAGTAGNVLIDGLRPTSKTDDLQSVLTRIPASDVARIEVIRGGAPGIDMQGQTVVANVILKKTDSTKLIAQLQDDIFLGDFHTVPYASVEFTRQAGDSTYEATLERYGNYDDSVGNGTHSVTDVLNDTTTTQRAHTTGMGTGGALNAAATVPLFGGQFKAKLTLEQDPWHDTVAYSGSPGDQFFTDRDGDEVGELGLHWIGKIGASELETLILQRLERSTDLSTQAAVGNDQVFWSETSSGETIARATLRYPFSAALNFETGAEIAYNYLDGSSTYSLNGVPVPLPSADALVDEKRGEVFAQATWKIDPQWLLEAGARFETSSIGETGDINLSRSFFYPKPRAVLTWMPDASTQIRLRYERVLGQLDFTNFVASSALSSTGVTAGNAELKPDQHMQYELSIERHFWGKGAVVATLLHEKVADVVDYVPVTNASGTFDAPGNIGSGQNNQFTLGLTLPLDKFWLPNGLLQATNIFRFSSVRDPVTGLGRHIAGQTERPQDVEITLSQDIDSLKSTWSIFYFNCWDEYYYRLEQTRHRKVTPPYVTLTWDYKPTPDWTYHFEFYNLGRFTYEDQLYDYAGPRDTGALTEIETLRMKSQVRFEFKIRKTFG